MQNPDVDKPPARLIIADDHELARSGLRAMLEGEADLEVVGEARDGVEAVALCAKIAPDLALLDIRMPRLDGLGAARAIRQQSPRTGVVMVTMHDSPEYLGEAIRAGAAGYVLKDSTRRDLLAAVRTVLRGEAFLNGALATRLIQQLSLPSGLEPGSDMEPLTPRETEVLARVVRGLTNKEIARELDIAPGTVKVHVERVIGKLGAADRTQAAVRAIERGLVPRSLW